MPVKTGHVLQQQGHMHIYQQQQQQQQLAAELAHQRNLTNQQIIENELAKIQQEKLRIQRQQEAIAQKVLLLQLHCVSIKTCHFYFLNNSVKRQPILTIFGRQHHE